MTSPVSQYRSGCPDWLRCVLARSRLTARSPRLAEMLPASNRPLAPLLTGTPKGFSSLKKFSSFARKLLGGPSFFTVRSCSMSISRRDQLLAVVRRGYPRRARGP
jgi:hypothetical protein